MHVLPLEKLELLGSGQPPGRGPAVEGAKGTSGCNWDEIKNARKSTRWCASKTCKDCWDWSYCSSCSSCSSCSYWTLSPGQIFIRLHRWVLKYLTLWFYEIFITESEQFRKIALVSMFSIFHANETLLDLFWWNWLPVVNSLPYNDFVKPVLLSEFRSQPAKHLCWSKE